MAAAAILLGLATAAVPARASGITPNETFDFAGVCIDCGGELADAALTLSGNYALGDNISGYFVSFTYDGTDLTSPFTITDQQNYLAFGVFTSLPGPAEIYIGVGNKDFTSHPGGNWSVDSPQADIGRAGVWAQTPEPASLLLLGPGLLGLTIAARKLRKA
jgi:hypothetical protein